MMTPKRADRPHVIEGLAIKHPPPHHPQGKPVIGLAGGIGAGKSTVAKALAELGCLVSDSDAAARAALRDPEIRKTLVSWWGSSVLDAQGEIERSKVASIIFADPGQRKRLEGLTHPWIEARRLEQFAAAPASTPALVIDAPLLLEAGLDRLCDAVIYVDAARPERLRRVMATRGWDEAELSKREKAQMPLDEKRRRADHVVQNNGDFSELKELVRRVLNEIVKTPRP